jgi:hypothetical protein
MLYSYKYIYIFFFLKKRNKKQEEEEEENEEGTTRGESPAAGQIEEEVAGARARASTGPQRRCPVRPFGFFKMLYMPCCVCCCVCCVSHACIYIYQIDDDNDDDDVYFLCEKM